MRVDVSPEALDAEPGRRSLISVSIFNDEPIIVAYRLRVLGLDPAWVTIDEPRLSLFPDSSGVALVELDLPRDAPAGERRIGVEVTSLTEPATTEIVEVVITTPVDPEARLEVEPASIFGTRSGSFGVAATNAGNTPLALSFVGDDPEEHLHFEFEPTMVELAPGERTHVQVTTRGRRPLFGAPAPRMFTVRAHGEGVEPFAMGSFIQRAWLSRGALSLLGLLAAVTIFAAVLTSTLGRVVDRSTANEDLLLQVVRGESETEAVTNPGSLAGTVTLLTSGTPVSGATAELFRADTADSVLSSTATGADGSFQFGGLAAGQYKLRFRGAGFTELWYPSALEFDNATEVEVTGGAQTGGVDVRLGGVPGSISGAVIGEDPGGGVVTLRVSAAVIDGPVDAVVTTAVLDATGEFLLEDVPAPSSYEIFVEKPGFASETRRVNIAAGESVEGIEIALREGDGSITGSVQADGEPVGGATVTATSGELQINTATLTQDNVGGFVLRNLPTPGTYTLNVSAPGFATETLSVRLSQGQQVDGMTINLRGGSGSIAGSVSLAGGGPVGGVTVTVSDGETVLSTRTLSVGEVGTYQVDDVPVPGTYTVTFAKEGLASHTRSVDLDAIGGATRSGVNAVLTPATAKISGGIKDRSSGQALGGVKVTVSSGDGSWATVSAHAPKAGAYAVGDLPPGTYTVTFSRAGSQPYAVLVTIAAGESRVLDAQMEPQASIAGRVTVDGVPTGRIAVRLHRIETYPETQPTTVYTNDDGTYSFTELDAPQTYIVEFTNPSNAVVASKQVTLLAGQQETGVDFNLGERREPEDRE